MFKEFKAFMFKGNVIDLAVATIVGVAFNNIIAAVVDNILMPIIGIIVGGKNFDSLAFQIGEAQIKYGTAISASIKFFIIALFLFMIVKIANNFKKDEAPAGPSSTDVLLQNILDELKKGK